MYQDIFTRLPDTLLPWYRENKRELPWRTDKDPYHIWLSEIMLQQTRVEAVKGYYIRFLQHFPTIDTLAQAEDEALFKLWEGLGYYSRARNLKKAAKIIIENYNGCFPKDYCTVLSLPGIGVYTAGAICSISYDMPTPAVDGNVLRLIARLTNDCTPVDDPAYKKKVHSSLCEIYPAQAGDFTQALMELGATICGPGRVPDCAKCPCVAFCKGRAAGNAEKLPVRQPKRQRREEDMTVFIVSCDGYYALQKRENTGLLAGLWQFPNVSGKLNTEDALYSIEAMGFRPSEILRIVDRKHIFTHVKWNMRGIYITSAEKSGGFRWLKEEQINAHAALPTAFKQFWEIK